MLSSKLSRSKFLEAREQLRADLELAHFLSHATPEMVPNLDEVSAVALASLAQTSAAYLSAGQSLGLGEPPEPEPEPEQPAPLPASTAQPMKTEDLFRLVDLAGPPEPSSAG